MVLFFHYPSLSDLFLAFFLYLVLCCWQPLIWQSNPCWYSKIDFPNRIFMIIYVTIPTIWILLPGGQVILDLFVKSLPSWLGSVNLIQWEDFSILERRIRTQRPVYLLFNVRWELPFPSNLIVITETSTAKGLVICSDIYFDTDLRWILK